MVSIITPVYNTEFFLPQYIESVLKQSYKEWELLLIDDGSTDNSLDVCNAYAESDKRIKVFPQNRGGVANARNVGLFHASGSYVMFADSDDYLSPNALEVTIKLITKEKADIVQASWYTDTNGIIRTNKRLIKRKRFDNKNAIRLFLNSRLLGGYICSKLYRTEILDKIKFPIDMSLGEDGVFAFQAFLNAAKVVYTSTPIYYYRIRNNSLSMRENANFCDRNLDVFKQIDYIHGALECKGKIDIHKNDEDVFRFYLCLGALHQYLMSNDETKLLYQAVGERLKTVCDEQWKRTLFRTTNPRIKLQALKYGLTLSKRNSIS